MMNCHSSLPRALAAAFFLLATFAAPVGAQKPVEAAATLRREADAAVAKKDFVTAAAAFKRLTEVDPKDAEAWHLLGYSLHADGKLDEALAAHQQAAKFPAVAGPATYNIACVYALKGQSDEAFRWLEKACTLGFDDAELLASDGDLDSLRKDARFAKLTARLQDPQANAAKLQVYVQSVDRKNSRITWFGRSGAPVEIAIDYTPVPWKDGYEAALAGGKFVGKKWRLGSDFWTRIDTWADLKFGGVTVPAGYYYLTLEQRDATTFVLALHDPVEIRKHKLDAYLAERVKGGIEVPMTHAAAKDVAKALDVALTMQKGSTTDGALTITFGGHQLTAPFQVVLP